MPREMRLTVPFFKQEKDYMCGPRSLQMVASYYGKQVTPEHFRRLSGTTPERGTKRAGMIAAMRQLDFVVNPTQETANDAVGEALKKGRPAIVNFLDFDHNEGHFGVIVGERGAHWLLHDPYVGPYQVIEKTRLARNWYGGICPEKQVACWDTPSKRWMMVCRPRT